MRTILDCSARCISSASLRRKISSHQVGRRRTGYVWITICASQSMARADIRNSARQQVQQQAQARRRCRIIGGRLQRKIADNPYKKTKGDRQPHFSSRAILDCRLLDTPACAGFAAVRTKTKAFGWTSTKLFTNLPETADFVTRRKYSAMTFIPRSISGCCSGWRARGRGGRALPAPAQRGDIVGGGWASP